MIRRLPKTAWIALATVALAAACGERCLPNRVVAASASAPSDARLERIDVRLSRASKFLAAGQSSDGAWRSDVYATFRHGDALTPLVLMALVSIRDHDQNATAIDKAADYLAGLVHKDGTVQSPEQPLTYPVYASAGAVIALANRSGRNVEAARGAWLAYLRRLQLTESLGWQPDDACYGGWGYAGDPPQKPSSGQPLSPLAEPNLSATAFALAALRAAGVAGDAPEVQKALRFVRRCQNFALDPAQRDGSFDDGGFFFIPSDPVRNKAGIVGTDRLGRERFASYGSATVDGLRALVMCGMPNDQPRVIAAWQWLAQNFSAQAHPGRYAASRESARQAVYYYYCHSLAELLADPHAQTATKGVNKLRWAEAIADELLERQRPDGSWRNSAVDVREDDPLVATSLATRALALCRGVIMVESAATRAAVDHDDRAHHPNPTAEPSR